MGAYRTSMFAPFLVAFEIYNHGFGRARFFVVKTEKLVGGLSLVKNETADGCVSDDLDLGNP